MGQGLYLGIATEIVVSTKDLSKDEIISAVNNAFSAELFDLSEGDDYIAFTVKAELLEQHLTDFLREQFTLLNTLNGTREKALLQGIQGMSAEEILLCGKQQDLPPAYCFVTDSRIGYCDYLFSAWPRWKRPLFQIHCFSYHSLYKTYIEEGTDQFFGMICSLVRQTSKNPLAKLFFVDMQ